MSINDVDDLEKQGTTLERLLSNLSVSMKRLVGSKEEKPLAPTASGMMGMSGVRARTARIYGRR